MVRKVWIALGAVMASAAIAPGQVPATQPAAATAPAWSTLRTVIPAPQTPPAPATQAAIDPPDAPTYITLHVKDAKGADVLREISQQAHIHVTGWPEFFWNGQQPGLIPNVTLDLDRVTFWTAVEAVCQITHSHPQFIGQPNDVTLVMGNAGHWDQEGRFAFVPMTINRASEVDLTNGNAHKSEVLSFAAYVDPKLHASHWDLPQISVAEDEQGNSLRAVGPADRTMIYSPISQQPWTVNLSVPLSFPAHYGNTLARLEGTIRVEFTDRSDVLEIKDVDKSAGSQASAANRKVEVLACSFDGKNTISAHVRISALATDPKSPANLSREFLSAGIEDADGQRMRPTGNGTVTNAHVDWIGTFAIDKAVKPPFTFRWAISTHYDPVTVAFKFKDLSLPPH
jgi:hypothetical protein